MQLVKDIGGALSRTAGTSNGASLDGFRPAASEGRQFSAVLADFEQHFGKLDRALVARGKDRQRVLSWPEFWDAVDISKMPLEKQEASTVFNTFCTSHGELDYFKLARKFRTDDKSPQSPAQPWSLFALHDEI